ncbi:hypothetical protein Q5O89_18945 [Peribacillus frigoritolerans]|nr:hypothetical protein [Peribacillus frigoritolerans]
MAWPKIVYHKEMKILEKDIDIQLADLAEERSVFKAAFFFMQLTGQLVA